MAGFADATKYDVDLDSGEIRGRRKPAACMSWTTSTGRVIPFFLKIEDEEGHYRIVYQIQVKEVSEKNYSGIPSLEYVCSGILLNKELHFKLLYFPLIREWEIVTS